MQINTFYVVIDRLCTQLDTKSEVYFNLNEKLECFYNSSLIQNDKIWKKHLLLAKKYHSDISDDNDIGGENVHFKELIKWIDFFKKAEKDNQEKKEIRNCL